MLQTDAGLGPLPASASYLFSSHPFSSPVVAHPPCAGHQRDLQNEQAGKRALDIKGEKCLERRALPIKMMSPNKPQTTEIRPLMQLTLPEQFTQFSHLLQQELFPLLEAAVGPLSKPGKLLVAVVGLADLKRWVSGRRARTGGAPAIACAWRGRFSRRPFTICPIRAT
jgi:hypothetical protein